MIWNVSRIGSTTKNPVASLSCQVGCVPLKSWPDVLFLGARLSKYLRYITMVCLSWIGIFFGPDGPKNEVLYNLKDAGISLELHPKNHWFPNFGLQLWPLMWALCSVSTSCPDRSSSAFCTARTWTKRSGFMSWLHVGLRSRQKPAVGWWFPFPCHSIDILILIHM